MKIEIIKTAVETFPKYRSCTVTYKGPDGKPESKRLMSFVYKDVFKLMSEAQQGDCFDVKIEKVKNDNDGKEYWQWTEATAAGKNLAGVSEGGARGGVGASVRSSYETPEERAQRQIYIVRQSSISNALEYIQAQGTKKFTEDDVIKTSKVFEAYVFGTKTDDVDSLVEEVKVV